jgi:hypothetical protein
LAAYGKAPAIFLDGYPLQGLQVLLDFGPLEAVVGLQQAPVKLFAEHQSQKTAKYMASDRGVSFVENRARIQRRFYPNVANFWCSTAGI